MTWNVTLNEIIFDGMYFFEKVERDVNWIIFSNRPQYNIYLLYIKNKNIFLEEKIFCY